MWIGDLGFERLSAPLVKKSRRFDSGLNSQLIFHTDAPKRRHGLVNRAEVELARLLLYVFPTDVQAHAREMRVSAHLSF